VKIKGTSSLSLSIIFGLRLVNGASRSKPHSNLFLLFLVLFSPSLLLKIPFQTRSCSLLRAHECRKSKRPHVASGLRRSAIAEESSRLQARRRSKYSREFSRLPRAASKLRLVFVEVGKTVSESSRCLPGLVRAVKYLARFSAGDTSDRRVSCRSSILKRARNARREYNAWRSRSAGTSSPQGKCLPASDSHNPDLDFEARLDFFRSTCGNGSRRRPKIQRH